MIGATGARPPARHSLVWATIIAAGVYAPQSSSSSSSSPSSSSSGEGDAAGGGAGGAGGGWNVAVGAAVVGIGVGGIVGDAVGAAIVGVAVGGIVGDAVGVAVGGIAGDASLVGVAVGAAIVGIAVGGIVGDASLIGVGDAVRIGAGTVAGAVTEGRGGTPGGVLFALPNRMFRIRRAPIRIASAASAAARSRIAGYECGIAGEDAAAWRS